jgi:hypothetical protein
MAAVLTFFSRFSLKLAPLMGRLTAEDAVKSIQNSRRTPELVAVQLPA